jgi:hypothetical protein
MSSVYRRCEIRNSYNTQKLFDVAMKYSFSIYSFTLGTFHKAARRVLFFMCKQIPLFLTKILILYSRYLIQLQSQKLN